MLKLRIFSHCLHWTHTMHNDAQLLFKQRFFEEIENLRTLYIYINLAFVKEIVFYLFLISR